MALSQASPASFSGGHYIIVKGRSSSCLSSKVALVRPQPVPDPESLPLHDVPKLAQIGLGNDIVRFELERTQVVGLGFGEFTIEVKDGAEVHQSSRVLGEGKGKARTGSKQQEKIILLIFLSVSSFDLTSWIHLNLPFSVSAFGTNSHVTYTHI